MTVTAPTAPYRVTAPPAYGIQQYINWFVDKAVRTGRDNGYGQIVDDAIELFLVDYTVRRPAGGFVDSDGLNARGQNTGGGYDRVTGLDPEGYNRAGFDTLGYNRDGLDGDGNTREDAVEALVDGWDVDYAAAVLTALAGRIG